ncbi:MAG TPA: proprotein convertase P-domain-containing protein, partial [Pirellulales bacterium]|nr:proprotein convertase P-domain-containing protein [Pirellulales bacterium]
MLSINPVAQPFAVALPNPVASPLAGSANPQGFSPAQIRHAYGVDQITFSGGSVVGDGAGQTVAIVTAYDNSSIAHDLQAFSTAFSLPVPTISPDLATFQLPANPGDPPKFVRVSQTGSNAYPATDSGWALETALDVEWVHAMAPKANIMLVEADSNDFLDLVQGAVVFARSQPGVSVISMSWGANEFFGETGWDSNFTTPSNHSNVAFVAATGDAGSPGTYPAYSPNVLAVGGTTLTLNGSNNISSETGWGGSGGGVSAYENQPAYQSGFYNSTKRTSPDVAAVADSQTGVSVYDSFNNGLATPWRVVGGTSLSAPLWSGLVAIADQGRQLSGLATLSGNSLMTKLYAMPASNFNDIVIGNSGGTTPQNAAAGYDLVTGRGSPKANLLVPALVGTSAITGTVFNDLDNNGQLNSEPGLAGWTVYADLNSSNSFDPVVTNTFLPNDLAVAKTIPTIGTITSNAPVSATGDVIDVNVTLKITHTRDSDLVLTLISPSGTRVTLANHVGGTGDNFTNTTFDDSGSVAISLGTAPFGSTYQPSSPLSALFGENPNGTWKLEVADTVSNTGGSLISWSLQLKSGDPNTTSAADGTYSLTNLPAGTYHVGEVLQGGFSQTSPPSGFYNSILVAGVNTPNQDFGNHVLQSSAPSSVVLQAISDTGISNSDGLTRLNNGSAGATLQFQVTGAVNGATVTVLADGVPIGSAVAAGSSVVVTTDGTTLLAEGSHSITAIQTEPGKSASSASPAASIVIDSVAPGASIQAVSPNPRANPVPSMTLNFTEAVSGVGLSNLSLTRDGGANLLAGQSVTSGDGLLWTLSDLTAATSPNGNYQLVLDGSLGPITDAAGNAYTGTTNTSFTVTASSIVSRLLFYNQSGTASPLRYDGNDLAINAADDNAIATDKVA